MSDITCQRNDCSYPAKVNYDGEMLCHSHSYDKYIEYLRQLNEDYNKAEEEITNKYISVKAEGIKVTKYRLIRNIPMIFIASPFILILIMFTTWLINR